MGLTHKGLFCYMFVLNSTGPSPGGWPCFFATRIISQSGHLLYLRMRGISLKPIHLTAFTILVALFALPIFLRPIDDPDFWYHLTAGKYMVEHRSLIYEDPFSFASGTGSSGAAMHSDNLRGYWLAQVLMYLTYNSFGFFGIIAARASLYAGTLILAYLWAIKKGAEPYIAALVLMPAALFLVNFTGDRPQLISFALAPLVLYTLESYTQNPRLRWPLITLPLMMIGWANAHRGYPMGSALIALYASVSFMRGQRGILTLAALGIGATLINPNGYATYLTMVQFEGSALQGAIIEYRPTLSAAAYGITLWPYLLYLALAALAVIGLEMSAAEAAITAALAAASLKAIRYVPFFVLCTLAPVSAGLTRTLVKRIAGRTLMRMPRMGLTLVMLIVMAAYSWLHFHPDISRLSTYPVARLRYPEPAVALMLKEHPAGRLMSTWTWGSYLMWRLYPQQRVFVDTRTLNLDAISDSIEMMAATPRGLAALDSYGISIVLIPPFNDFTGQLNPLLEYLAANPQWRLIHYDETSVLFVRGDENAELIRRLAVPSVKAYESMLRHAALVAPVAPPAVRAELEAQVKKVNSTILRMQQQR